MKIATIGHAVQDENKKASGGKPGDQTEKEVLVAKWYCHESSPWYAVFRAKKSATRKKIAKAMEQACANDNIGYDQSNRTTLFKLAQANGFQLDKVGLCETDCSALVSVCVNAAGIPVSKDMYTGIELETLKATGKFKIYQTDDYCKSQDKLKRGDILLKKGHTAIVLNVEDVYKDVVATKYPAAKDPSLAGTYVVHGADALNVRNGAGTGNSIMVVINKGQTVTCDGSYTEYNGRKWLYVKFTIDNYINYTGYCSSLYLKKTN